MANEIIRPTALTARASPVASEVTVSDNGSSVAGVTWADGVNAAVPVASQLEAESGVDNSKRMTPLTTKQSITSEVGVSIASIAQGGLADTAVQPGDLAAVATSGDYGDLDNKPTLGTAAAADTGDFATAAQGATADSAVQPGDLGDLAFKDKASVSDIDATGTPNSTTFLRGDGSWIVPAGGGDMLSSTYDPRGIAKDVFDQYAPGSLFGLTLSNNAASPLTSFDVLAGACRDIANLGNITILSTYTKNLTVAWSTGSGGGALDAGSVAISTTYHIWAIKRPDTGTCDILASTSPTNPTMPTNYTLKRRIGAVMTSVSGGILPFRQVGGWFHWKDPILDNQNVDLAGAARNIKLTVPQGIKCHVEVSLVTSASTGGVITYMCICDPDLGAAGGADNVSTFSAALVSTQVQCFTNTVSEVSVYSFNSGGLLSTYTRGWYDGRDTYI